MTSWRTVAALAGADLRAEPTLAACSILTVAAVLAPLVVLAGLRAGVVDGLRRLLLENPHAREIVTAANRDFPSALLKAIAARPDVAFLAPRTRTLSSSIVVQPDPDSPLVRIELLPTLPGDPLTPASVTRNSDIVLSESAAAKLHVGQGRTLTAKLGRIRNGQREVVSIPLHVIAVAPPASFAREAAFIAVPLAALIEDFQDGTASIPADIESAAPKRDEYAGFRLYATKLEDVPALDGALRQQGLDIVSHAEDVASLEAVDQGLGALFTTVAALGGSGFLVSLGAGLWANVERKRVQLALMRFLGLRAASLRLFPLVQALLIAAGGSTIGIGTAAGAAMGINTGLAGVVAIQRPLCVIGPDIIAMAFGLTLGGAAIVALVASWRAGRIEPWEGINAP